jgi:hypothetical protein
MSIEEVARRRMQNTGETFAIALQAVAASIAIVDRDHENDGTWFKAWVEEPPVPIPEDARTHHVDHP